MSCFVFFLSGDVAVGAKSGHFLEYFHHDMPGYPSVVGQVAYLHLRQSLTPSQQILHEIKTSLKLMVFSLSLYVAS